MKARLRRLMDWIIMIGGVGALMWMALYLKDWGNAAFERTYYGFSPAVKVGHPHDPRALN